MTFSVLCVLLHLVSRCISCHAKNGKPSILQMGGSRSSEVAVPRTEQWPRLQKKVAGSGGDGKSVKGRWRSGAPNAQFPNKVRTVETAIAALGPDDISVKAELEAAVACAKIQFQGPTRTSPTPDVAVAEAKKKVFRLEKALEAFGDSPRTEVDFLKKAFAKAHEAAR